jgi:hypothetical protein
MGGRKSGCRPQLTQVLATAEADPHVGKVIDIRPWTTPEFALRVFSNRVTCRKSFTHC